MKKAGITLGAFCAIILFLVACPRSGKEDTAGGPLSAGWQVPVEVADTPNATQPDYYQLGWQSFVALNWPANMSYRGEPDTSKSIGAAGDDGQLQEVVWESWKEQYDIFLPDAANPGPWNPAYSGAHPALKVLRMFSKNDSSRVLDAFNEATGNPVIDQDSQFVRYEVRVDQSEYTYFVTNSYYNQDSQLTAVQQDRFVGFPKGNVQSPDLPSWAQYGATEVKAAWRIFKPGTPSSILDRYYHEKALLIDQYGVRSDTVEIGMVSMHILRLTPTTGSTWYWASFEQVDNLKLQPSYGGTLPPHPTFNTNPAQLYGDSGFSYKPAPVAYRKPLPSAVPVGISSPPFEQSNPGLDSINMEYHKKLSNTPFQYYQLIGTINPPVSGQPSYTDSSSGAPSVTVNTPLMSNSAMETYICQSNCITCHMFGFPFTPNQRYNTSSLQVFTFLPSMAKSSSQYKLKKIQFVKPRVIKN